MQGYPAAALHAEGANFAGVGGPGFPTEPHAGKAGNATGVQAVFGEGADNGFLQRAEVPMNVGPEIVEVENGVAHQLAGAVVGDVAAPVDAVEAGVVRGQAGVIEQQVLRLAALAQRVGVRVLTKQQVVGRGGAGFAGGLSGAVLGFEGQRGGHQFLLQLPGGHVFDQPQTAHQQGLSRGGSSARRSDWGGQRGGRQIGKNGHAAGLLKRDAKVTSPVGFRYGRLPAPHPRSNSRFLDAGRLACGCTSSPTAYGLRPARTRPGR